MTVANEDVIRAVMQAWGEGLAPAAAAIREHFADDCVWEQTGFPTTHGPEEAARLILSMERMGFGSIDVEFRNVVASDRVVCTERVDWLVRDDGSRVGPFPVVGITEFRAGKISAWREYFDTAHLALLAGDE